MLLDALETPPLQCRLLRIADRRLDLALEIWCVWPAGQRDDAVMLEHFGVERVDLRVVDVGLDDALFEVVESDRARRATEEHERLLVQPAPHLRRRVPNDFTKCVAAVAERHDEQPRPAVLTGARIARQRALAVVNLSFLSWLGFKPTTDLRFTWTELADQSLDGIVRAGVAVVLDEVLLDRHAVAPLGELGLEPVSARLRAESAGPSPDGSRPRGRCAARSSRCAAGSGSFLARSCSACSRRR